MRGGHRRLRPQDEQEASVRVGNAETEANPIKTSVRQGCVASPDLFNLYQEMITLYNKYGRNQSWRYKHKQHLIR